MSMDDYSGDMDAIRQQRPDALLDAWVLLNKHGWPEWLRSEQPESRRDMYPSKLMESIQNCLGVYLVLRHLNKDRMTDDEFHAFWTTRPGDPR